MKKIVFIAAVALAAAACSKTYSVGPDSQKSVGFSSWNDVMTKADKSAFVANDEIEVYGYKHNDGADIATVFNDVDVKYDGANWTYSPIRFWDRNFSHYTFFGVYPKDKLNSGDYAQNGLFATGDFTYDGASEQLLIAKKTTVAKPNFGQTVNLTFKHLASKVDIKVKKHTEILDVKLTVNSISVNDIQTKGSFTVSSYDGSNNPVGSWAVASSPVKNDNTVAPYKNATAVEIAAGANTPADLIIGLIAMPQTMATGTGAQTITINYTLTTGVAPNLDSVNYTKTFEIGAFDKTNPDPSDKNNTTPFISAWEPGVHYTYYITINADNKITFSADIEDWADATVIEGHHYIFQ
jgi:hypothetical protein